MSKESAKALKEPTALESEALQSVAAVPPAGASPGLS